MACHLDVFLGDCLPCGAGFPAIGTTPGGPDCGDAATMIFRNGSIIHPEPGLSHG